MADKPFFVKSLSVNGFVTANTTNFVVGPVNFSSNTANNQATLGLTIGTNVQAYAANLTGWAGITTASKQAASANLDGWSAITTSTKQNQSANLDAWSAIATSTKQAAAANLDGWAAITTASKQAALGYTPVNKAGDTAIGQLTGTTISLAMSADTTNNGNFVCRATGTGDANLAGMTFWNDTYAIKLGVRNDGVFSLGGWSRTAHSWYTDTSGNMVAAGNVTAYSDPRLKKNFKKIKSAVSLIQKLDGGTFVWKKNIPHTACKAGKKDYGVLADQVEAIFPEMVSESIDIDDVKYKMVAYEKLIPVLIEAIKELKSEIEELKAR